MLSRRERVDGGVSLVAVLGSNAKKPSVHTRTWQIDISELQRVQSKPVAPDKPEIRRDAPPQTHAYSQKSSSKIIIIIINNKIMISNTCIGRWCGKGTSDYW